MDYLIKLARLYFYVIGISYNKSHFTCIWVVLSRFKNIISWVCWKDITSGTIEDMKTAQRSKCEKLKTIVSTVGLMLASIEI